MLARRRPVVAALVATAAIGASGCGGGDDGGGASVQSAPRAEPQPLPPNLALPDGVPQRATGPADHAAVLVIRRWIAALNRGDVRRAARFFALPSKFQNGGTPVLTINTERERIAVNLSLPCGGRPIRIGGAAGFTIVTFRLLDRPGGDCGRGTGGTARGAIRVAGGRIREWYRLADGPGEPPSAPPAEGQPA